LKGQGAADGGTARMKRSAINGLIQEAVGFLRRQNFALPPFAVWSPQRWREMGPEADEIRANMLGWDLTDFGSGDFGRRGLLLFTIRNGNIGDPGGKGYCEKIMVVRPGQVTPMHFHFRKMEDIINRGGGNLVCRLYNATADEGLDESGAVKVSMDGVRRRVAAGGTVELGPGESVTLPPRLYHSFWGKPGGEMVLVGEVSAVNDDRGDNRFLEPLGRFPAIQEDEPPAYLLCSEYPAAGD
jgi:D-lyxose ketol-isomerase